MVRRELKEVADYVADTIVNLYFLVNSTSTNPSLEKTLQLPSEIGGSRYYMEITFDGNNVAQTIRAVLQSRALNVASWLPRGLKVDTGKTQVIQSSGPTVVAGCKRVVPNVLIWIAYEG